MLRVRTVLVLFALLLAACAEEGGGPGRNQGRSDENIDNALSAAFQRAAEDSPFRYRILQSELQSGGDMGTIWVIQIADPLEQVASLALDETPDTSDLMFGWPMDMYRDALMPNRALLKGIDTYILSIRDQCQTVYEIKRPLMEEYLRGAISTDEVVGRMSISGLTGCP